MPLHILTISSRFHLLSKIWETIKDFPDITWHIAKSVFREDIPPFTNDSRVVIYNISTEDSDTSFKMNYLLREIKDLGGYFCILDDDSEFVKEAYEVYKRYEGSKIGMIIGNQIDKWGRIRLQSSYPRQCCIDTGNVICHTSVLEKVEWPEYGWTNKIYVDFEFWDACFKYFGLKYTDLVSDVISVYNSLSDVKDSLDYVRD